MKNIENDSEYKYIISDIMDNEEFSKLENIKHHDNNRLTHSLKVSYYSYLIAKKLRLNYTETARGGLLHDFFLERTVDYDNIIDKVKLYTIQHPKDAVAFAKKHFEVTDMEEDMIKSHMFPLDVSVPKYLESWIVNLVDTTVSTYEFTKKFSYKLSYLTNIYIILLLNLFK